MPNASLRFYFRPTLLFTAWANVAINPLAQAQLNSSHTAQGTLWISDQPTTRPATSVTTESLTLPSAATITTAKPPETTYRAMPALPSKPPTENTKPASIDATCRDIRH